MDMLTVADFCAAAQISRSTWQKMKRQGRTPRIVSVGGVQRLRREAVEAWLAENEDQAVANAAHQAAEQSEPLTVAIPEGNARV